MTNDYKTRLLDALNRLDEKAEEGDGFWLEGSKQRAEDYELLFNFIEPTMKEQVNMNDEYPVLAGDSEQDFVKEGDSNSEEPTVELPVPNDD